MRRQEEHRREVHNHSERDRNMKRQGKTWTATHHIAFTMRRHTPRFPREADIQASKKSIVKSASGCRRTESRWRRQRVRKEKQAKRIVLTLTTLPRNTMILKTTMHRNSPINMASAYMDSAPPLGCVKGDRQRTIEDEGTRA